MEDLDVRTAEDGVSFPVRVKPRASKSRVLGVREGFLEVAVAAPPVDGAANDALCETLARHLGVPRRAVVIDSGETGRRKRVSVRGLGRDALLAKIPTRG